MLGTKGPILQKESAVVGNFNSTPYDLFNLHAHSVQKVQDKDLKASRIRLLDLDLDLVQFVTQSRLSLSSQRLSLSRRALVFVNSLFPSQCKRDAITRHCKQTLHLCSIDKTQNTTRHKQALHCRR